MKCTHDIKKSEKGGLSEHRISTFHPVPTGEGQHPSFSMKEQADITVESTTSHLVSIKFHRCVHQVQYIPSCGHAED